jgi:hypothetical protein
MSDFVTRLEQELHRAAVRQEGAGALGVALPRVRSALPGVVGGALAGAAVAIAVVAVVAAFLASSPERRVEGGVPAELRHTWRLPTELVLKYTPMAAQLRFYPSDSKRCADLGLGSKPCYAIEGVDARPLEWGTVSISEGLITFRAAETHWCLPAGCNESGSSSTIDTPGVYGWELRDGSLRLTPESDLAADRPEVLASGPLTRVGREAPARTAVPEGWTRKRFVSERYGYSIRYPRRWSALPAATYLPEGGLPLNTSRMVDKLSRNPRTVALPLLMIGAYDLPKGTTLEKFTAMITDSAGSTCPTSGRRRESIGGEPATITVYPSCPTDLHHQWATLVHAGRGYQITWSGAPGDAAHDRPLFDALLETFAFRG